MKKLNEFCDMLADALLIAIVTGIVNTLYLRTIPLRCERSKGGYKRE